VGSCCHGNACNRLQAFKHDAAQRVACAKDGFRRANICAWCIRSFVSFVVCCHWMRARSCMRARRRTGCTLAAFHCPAASAHHTQYAALQEERPQHGGFSVKYSLRSYAVWLVSHSLSNDDVHAQMHNYGAPVEPNRSVSSLHLRKRPSSSSRVSVTRSLARTGCSRPAVHVRNFGHQCRNADRR